MARFNFADAGVYCIQQTVSGTGEFNGTRFGYAVYRYSSGGVVFDVRCPYLGTDGNGIKFQLIAPTSDCLVTFAVYDKALRTLRVHLKGSAAGITATAAEVVAAINGMERPVLFAGVVTPGTIPAALAPTNLSGGVDPDISASYSLPKFTVPTNGDGGLITFDQTRPWKILSVGGEFAAAGTYQVEIVNVDKALNVIPGLSINLMEQTDSTAPYQLRSSRLDIPIMPGQAVLVKSDGQPGTIYVTGTAIASLDNIAD